jgi:hypothetical protein
MAQITLSAAAIPNTRRINFMSAAPEIANRAQTSNEEAAAEN